MTQADESAVAIVTATCEQRVYPPYDALHGTPHALLWRRVVISTPRGDAMFEQTDYGHPGRLNPWEPRGVATRLLPNLRDLLATAEAIAMLQQR